MHKVEHGALNKLGLEYSVCDIKWIFLISEEENQ